MRDVLQLQKSGGFEGVVDCKEILTVLVEVWSQIISTWKALPYNSYVK